MAAHFELARDSARVAAVARKLGQELPPARVEQLGRYVELVARWNQKLDLTAAREADAQIEVLLADAIVLAREELVPHGSKCVDVGSGAGAPAIPMLLLRDDLDALLVEPLRKRVAFIRTVLGTLGLVARCRVLEAKLDEHAPQVAGAPFELAMSRATFAPELWVEVGSKLAPRTLVLLATQAPPPAPAGTELANVVSYKLPRSGHERSIAVYVRK